MELVRIMKALADETRMRILNLLGSGELCVCELEYILDINQSNASRHLNKLTAENIISYEKRALYVYYRINEEVFEEYPFIKEFIRNELIKVKKCAEDNRRLSIYKKSGMSCDNLKQGKVCLDK